MKYYVGLVSLIVASSSFAFNAPHIDINKHIDSLSGKRTLSRAACTNFTGSWEGSCVITHNDGSQDVSPASMVIDQYECDSITIDDTFDLEINGKKDEAETTARWTSTTSYLPYFNNGGDLEVDMNSYGRSLGDTDQYISKGTGDIKMSINAKGELLDNVRYDATIIDIRSKETHAYSFSSACTFTQVNK